MYCKNCSMKLEEGVLFCPNCGSRVEEGPIGARQDDLSDRTVLIDDDIQTAEQNPQDGDVQEKEAQETEIPAGTEPETVEALQISPTGVVETNEAVVVPQNNNAQKKYCPNCGTANNINDLFCQECGMFFGNAADKTGQENAVGAKQKKKVWKIAVPIIAGVAAIALCILFLPRLFAAVGGQKAEKNYLLYIKDNELYLAEPNKYEPVQIDEKCYDDKDDAGSGYSYSSHVSVSPDGKYLYYPVNLDNDYNTYGFDLYRKKIGSKKAEEEKIDSDVVFYKIIDKDRLIYIKDNKDRKLYLYSQENSEKIASDVASVNVSEDGKNLVWKTSDEEQRLYAQELSLKQDKVKLDSDVEWYQCSADLNTIVYGKDENLYLLRNLDEKEKIASDVMINHVYGIDGDLKIYYTKEGDEIELTAYDFIEDDYLAQDQKLTEPRIEDYQTKTYVNDFFGTREKIETDDAYYEAMEQYQQKLARDYIREYLSDETMDGTASDIYYYDGKKKESTKVKESVMIEGYPLPTETTALMYLWDIDVEKIEGIKLSSLMELSESEVESRMTESMIMSAQLLYIKDGEVLEVPEIDWDEIDLEAVSDLEVGADEEAHVISIVIEYAEYDDEEPSYRAEVYFYDYTDPDAELTLISDEVAEGIDYISGEFYYVNTDGDMYRNDSKVDSDVYSYAVKTREDGTLLYLTDIDSNEQEGTLKLYQNGKSTKIADDVPVNGYGFFDGNKIAFLSDYNFKKSRGDLKIYDGKETVNVDSDVQQIVFY